MEKTIEKELDGNIRIVEEITIYKEDDVDIYSEITQLLNKIGAPHIQGYNYLREAIQIAYEEKRIKQLYAIIAKRNKTTQPCVVSSINRVIERVFRKENRENIERIFGETINQDKMRNLEFIAMFVDNLRSKHRKETTVTKIMNQIGVPADIKGYQYLEEAILMVYENKELIHSVTKNVYPKIGSKYNISPINVECTIRYAILETWKRGEITKVFGTDYRKKPTNSEFILTIANNIKN